jgi:hypothetical protein
MAKSQLKKVAAMRNLQSSAVRPLRARLAEKVVISINVEKEAAAIVAHVLAHFGAGYGAERQRATGGTPSNVEIFKTPAVLKGFHALLLNSTIDNFMDVHWDVESIRKQILNAAFEHGVRARKRVVQDGSNGLSLQQILDTLEDIQSEFCPPGAGGGAVCSF